MLPENASWTTRLSAVSIKTILTTLAQLFCRLRVAVPAIGLLLLSLGALGNPLLAASTNFQFKAEAALKETYDSNVYLQDAQPDPANVAAARAAGFDPVEPKKASWVTSLLPKVGLDYKPAEPFSLAVGYAPDISFYHSASSEDYVAHRGSIGIGGKVGATAWELLNSATYIDGDTDGPTFARPGEIPALGGIPLRDRREALVYRNSFRLTHLLGDWFVRPVASSYIHDFKARQRFLPPAVRHLYSYENYIDRQDVHGGVDLGYRILERTYAVLGYRYGRQEQFEGPFGPEGRRIDSPYDSAYHRVLVGLEGSPADWLRVNLLIGPEIRQFDAAAHRTYPAFVPDELLYYMDGSFTLLPTKRDTVTLRATRFEQPAFSSFSVYEDIRNDLLWRHQFNPMLAATVGFTLYIGQWQPPAQRSDWIYSPNTSLVYAFTRKFTGELGYAYEWVDSRVSASLSPYTRGIEYSRHLVTAGLRYAF